MEEVRREKILNGEISLLGVMQVSLLVTWIKVDVIPLCKSEHYSTWRETIAVVVARCRYSSMWYICSPWSRKKRISLQLAPKTRTKTQAGRALYCLWDGVLIHDVLASPPPPRPVYQHEEGANMTCSVIR